MLKIKNNWQKIVVFIATLILIFSLAPSNQLKLNKTNLGETKYYSISLVSNDSSSIGLLGESWESDLTSQILPNAVNKLLQIPIFNEMANQGRVSNEISLYIYSDSSSTALASVGCRWGQYGSTIAETTIEFRLSLNKYSFINSNGEYVDDTSKEKLKSTILHELMHAFMYDLCPNGMLGANESKVIDKETHAFPLWFSEGLAQTCSGAMDDNNDWVNKSLNINGNSTTSAISTAISKEENKLSSTTSSGSYAYGTGYLACMYLAYLQENKPNEITTTTLRNGISSIIENIINGCSLDTIIKYVSKNAYTNLEDFENNFATDATALTFIKTLLSKTGDKSTMLWITNRGGNGSILASNFSDYNFLEDVDATTSYYNLTDESTSSSNNWYTKSSANSVRKWDTGTKSTNGSNFTQNASGDCEYLGREHTFLSDCDETCNNAGCTHTRETTQDHTPILINDREPTTSLAGYTGDTICDICGHFISEGEEIPVLEDDDTLEDTPNDTPNDTPPSPEPPNDTPPEEESPNDSDLENGNTTNIYNKGVNKLAVVIFAVLIIIALIRNKEIET